MSITIDQIKEWMNNLEYSTEEGDNFIELVAGCGDFPIDIFLKGIKNPDINVDSADLDTIFEYCQTLYDKQGDSVFKTGRSVSYDDELKIVENLIPQNLNDSYKLDLLIEISQKASIRQLEEFLQSL